jgi:hypothetical protein
VAEESEHVVPLNTLTGDRWTVSDALGVLDVFERMLLAMEARLIQKIIDSNQTTSDRFERLEKNLAIVEAALNLHLKEVEREDIVMAARVEPVKQTFGWLWIHWRDLALLAISLLAVATLLAERLTGSH